MILNWFGIIKALLDLKYVRTKLTYPAPQAIETYDFCPRKREYFQLSENVFRFFCASFCSFSFFPTILLQVDIFYVDQKINLLSEERKLKT